MQAPESGSAGHKSRGFGSHIKGLLSSGAVRSRPAQEGRIIEVTEAGQARLRRLNASADPFAAQHSRRETLSAGSDGAALTINTEESPLLWLKRRKSKTGEDLLGDAEFAAGERLRADFTIAHLMPRMGADWERQGGGGVAIGLTPSEARMAARQRVERAMTTVGPEFSGLLLDVCCFLKGMDQVERERFWPARSAKVVLCLGLAALARHYGYGNLARGPQHGRGITMWGAEDFRPEFNSGPAPDGHPA
jgi:hypothetical protein